MLLMTLTPTVLSFTVHYAPNAVYLQSTVLAVENNSITR